ncbi:helix-turn-helix transcriptional regulator [Enterococcus faecium]|uniref:helix-turn-helix transcriptional regulator n=1 Tax=Enterococcus faecium TaxID=1352 RepID=UPI000CF2FEE5|nr:helix-turn-helix domain-containing protein [Enterococcus faecium]EMF0555270.1 helix-turn-helix domain-containing protein [Enterococcus faecium]PQD84192.1 DNA-binding protein [Enterococcus faecium]
MTEMKILLSDDQMGIISTQLSDLITTEIEKIKTQENLQHRYMNKKQTCNYLKVSNNTLDGWIKDGLPLIQIHGSNRFDRIAIDQWLTSLAK